MATREEVIWAYRLFLGREPESEAVIALHCRLPDIAALRHTLLNSAEFAAGNRLSWLVSGLHGYWVAAPVQGGRYLMWIDLGDRYVSSGCLGGTYEEGGTAFMRAALRPGDVVADVGANLGWFTLVASAVVGDRGRVHAFEPRRETADHLEKTVALNGLGRRVRVHRCALSDRAGEATLAWLADTDNPGGAFLTPGAPAEGMVGEAVPLRTLDDLALPRLDFLKIDVEGAELRVLRGARQTLERCRPPILAELHPEMLRRVSGADAPEYFAWFAALGYRALICDGERRGEEIRAFPPDWPWPLVNLALLPNGRKMDWPPAAGSGCAPAAMAGAAARRAWFRRRRD